MSSSPGAESAFEATSLGFLWRQFTRPKPLPAGTRIVGQAAIITGSNVGIGFEASRQLLQLGLARLVMGVRSQQRGDEAAARLRSEFPTATISVWLVDMEAYDSICAFADRCASLPRIDIAILNASIISPSYNLSPSTNKETTLQVNYLSTVLLAILLLPTMKAKKVIGAMRPPVLSIVGSDLFYAAKIETNSAVLPQLNNASRFDSLAWYRKTKLLQIIFVLKLAGLISPEDVLINVVNPGITANTELLHGLPALTVFVLTTSHIVLARSVDVGAITYLDAVLGYGAECHGSFISEWRVKPYPPICYTAEGEALRTRLWQETMEELNFVCASSRLEALCRSGWS